MKYLFEILDMLTFILSFSIIVLSVLIIGEADFLSMKKKVIIAICLFVILYFAINQTHEIFSGFIHNLKK